MEAFGIENLKRVIGLPIELGNIGDAIGAENSSDWRRWFKLIDALDEVMDLMKVDWKILTDELQDISDEEHSELRLFIKEKFDIKEDKLEGIIEETFDILLGLMEVIKKSISLSKSTKE